MLDEIGELPLAAQVRSQGVLQSKAIERIGAQNDSADGVISRK